MILDKEMEIFMRLYVAVITQTASEVQKKEYESLMQKNIGLMAFYSKQFFDAVNAEIVK